MQAKKGAPLPVAPFVIHRILEDWGLQFLLMTFLSLLV
jgi:hypothetical protein